MPNPTRYLVPNPIRRIPQVLRRNAETADDQAKPDVAQHLRYAASTLEGAIKEGGAFTAEDCAPCVAVPDGDTVAELAALGPFPNRESARDHLSRTGLHNLYRVVRLEEDV